MKKRRQGQATGQQFSQQKDETIRLGDLLQSDLADKLKNLKREKEQELQKQKEEEEARKAFERKEKEKNKSFAQLLDESNIDWKKFK